MKKSILCAAVCALVLAMGVGCSQQSSSSESGTSSNTSNVQSETGSQTQNADIPVTSGQGESSIASESKSVTANLYIGANGQFKEYPTHFQRSQRRIN